MYKGVDDLKYLLKNGDSVIFDYKDHKPIARIINRKEDYKVTNFSLVERDSLAIDEYMAAHILKLPILLHYRAKDMSREDYVAFLKTIDQTALKNIPLEVERQYSTLERLKAERKIGDDQFQYRLKNIYYQLLELRTSPLNKKGVENLNYTTLNSAIQNFEKRFPFIKTNREDSLLFNVSYNSFFHYSTSLEFSSKVEHYKYKTETASGIITNYPQAYDSVQASSQLSEAERKVLQFKYIQKLFADAGYFPIETRWEYLNKFKNDYQDSIMVNYLVEQFNIKFSIDDDLQLVDKKGRLTSFDSLIASNQGKVIYIDFWASWCGPCINEMPNSKKLQAELADKNITYIYLSADHKDRPWQLAMQRLGLIEGQHFRMDNAGYSIKMQELNIPSLPHYMIYDTKGQLVNSNAPRPSQKELLKKELLSYIETSR